MVGGPGLRGGRRDPEEAHFGEGGIPSGDLDSALSYLAKALCMGFSDAELKARG